MRRATTRVLLLAGSLVLASCAQLFNNGGAQSTYDVTCQGDEAPRLLANDLAAKYGGTIKAITAPGKAVTLSICRPDAGGACADFAIFEWWPGTRRLYVRVLTLQDGSSVESLHRFVEAELSKYGCAK